MRPPLAVLTLLGLLLTVAGPAPARAADPPPYVALGDSYASGLGTRDYDHDGCRRSVRAYPALVAAGRGWALTSRACAGATTTAVRRDQVGALRRSTRYVSISVGGNDAGFRRVLTACAKPWWAARCGREVDAAEKFVREVLPSRLRSLYAAVRDRAPRARVVAVGYPRLFMGEDCNAGTWFSPAEQRRLNAAADLLNATTGRAARAHGVGFADPSSRFTGHAVCDEAEWVNGLSRPVEESYHPNRAGHALGYAPLVGRVLAAR